MIREIPASAIAADDLETTQLSTTRKRVQVGFEPALRFEVGQQGDRWLVISFHVMDR